MEKIDIVFISLIIVIVIVFLSFGFNLTGKVINSPSNQLVSSKNINSTNPAFYLCNDSDNGKDYYSQGTVIIRGIKKGTDTCLESKPKRVKEYYCLSKTSYAYTYYDCPYKCLNGRCLTINSS
jgi:hypothetical protein